MDYIYFVCHLSLLAAEISFAPGFFLMITRSHPVELNIGQISDAVIDLDQWN